MTDDPFELARSARLSSGVPATEPRAPRECAGPHCCRCRRAAPTLLLIGADRRGRATAPYPGGWVLLLAAIVVVGAGLVAEPGATLFVVCAAWLTVAGFSRPPYAQLQVTWLTGARAALVLSLAGLAANRGRRDDAQAGVVGHTGGCGDCGRRRRRVPGGASWARPAAWTASGSLPGWLLVAVLPLLTAVLVPAQVVAEPVR